MLLPDPRALIVVAVIAGAAARTESPQPGQQPGIAFCRDAPRCHPPALIAVPADADHRPA
ncbi:hypothetical protein [Actinoplanes sp. HUAS TT8]|uniref:hypothetical protein n=1 Tax=Actinoplanes sp. HUAS TT8 TaxID=3447453 RepID=UPI003F51F892